MTEPSHCMTTYIGAGGVRVWSVSLDGSPLAAPNPNMAAVVGLFQRTAKNRQVPTQNPKPQQEVERASIPLWDGDAGAFTTLGKWEATNG